MQLWSDLSSISCLWGETNKGWWVLITNNLDRLDKKRLLNYYILKIKQEYNKVISIANCWKGTLNVAKDAAWASSAWLRCWSTEKSCIFPFTSCGLWLREKEGMPIWEARTTKYCVITNYYLTETTFSSSSKQLSFTETPFCNLEQNQHERGQQ